MSTPINPGPYGPYPNTQGVPPQQPKKKRGWIPWVVAGALGLTFGAALGSGGESATVTTNPEVTVTATETVDARPAEEPTEDPTTQAPAPEKEGPVLSGGMNSIGKGKDAPAGQYTGKAPEGGCYWARLKNDGGDIDAIISNGAPDGGDKISVTVKKGEFFENDGCGDLKKK